MHIEKDGTCKMYRQNKKCCCAGKNERRKNNAGTDKKGEKKLAGPLAKKATYIYIYSKNDWKHLRCAYGEGWRV